MATSAPARSSLSASSAGVDPGGRRQREVDVAAEDGDPAQRQAQLVAGAQDAGAGATVERLQVDVRLEKRLNSDQAVGPGLDRAAGPCSAAS